MIALLWSFVKEVIDNMRGKPRGDYYPWTIEDHMIAALERLELI